MWWLIEAVDLGAGGFGRTFVDRPNADHAVASACLLTAWPAPHDDGSSLV